MLQMASVILLLLVDYHILEMLSHILSQRVFLYLVQTLNQLVERVLRLLIRLKSLLHEFMPLKIEQ